MRLYASGMNAWSQLRFNAAASLEQPDDIYEFEVILEGGHIKPPTSTLVSTTAWCDGRDHHAGSCVSRQNSETSLLCHHDTVENFAGETLTVEEEVIQNERNPPRYTIINKTRSRLATDQVVRQSWQRTQPVAQVAAFHVGFVILYQDGTVETLGDRRFPDCLARDIDDDQFVPLTSVYLPLQHYPAEKPHTVQALLDLDDPVRAIAAGGYTIAALTESGALYIWGMAPPGDVSKQQAIAGLNHIPNYIEVDGEKDVKGIAVGEFHAIALTTDGHVYVIGRNDDGQLGLGKGIQASVDSWTMVNLHLPPGDQVASVAAGPRTSFILVSHQ